MHSLLNKNQRGSGDYSNGTSIFPVLLFLYLQRIPTGEIRRSRPATTRREYVNLFSTTASGEGRRLTKIVIAHPASPEKMEKVRNPLGI